MTDGVVQVRILPDSTTVYSVKGMLASLPDTTFEDSTVTKSDSTNVFETKPLEKQDSSLTRNTKTK